MVLVYKSEFLAEDVIAEEEEEEEEGNEEDAPDIIPTDNPGKTWNRETL